MSDPAEIYSKALAACSRGEWPLALQLALELLPQSASHGGVHFIAGVASMELHQLPAAVTYLRRAVVLEPERVNFATLYAKALSLAGCEEEALVAADNACALQPSDPGLLLMLGTIYALHKAHVRSAALLQQAVESAPHHAMGHYQLAMSLMFLGRVDEAEDALETCLRLAPTTWKAHLSLTMLRRQTRDRNHLVRLEQLKRQQENSGAESRAFLNLALAKEYEDLADYPQAFSHLVRGKSAAREGRNYSIERDQALFAELEDAFPVPLIGLNGCSSDIPIFIVGMPRSGTTLVERILSSHPDVATGGEMLNFGTALKRLSGSRTPMLIDSDTIARAQHINWKTLGESYLTSTRAVRGDASRFIDKLPLNFLYAGFIARALPNAKIVCMRRDPMDTCLSNFRQLFAADSPYFDYSYDLLDTGHYFKLFDRLMTHWQDVLPGRIYEVRYELLVAQQEQVSRDLLAFCDLHWDDACLRFQDNQAPVATASAVQVREAMNSRSVGRWKCYGEHLRDLQNLIGNT